jgi:hypothetical protein
MSISAPKFEFIARFRRPRWSYRLSLVPEDSSHQVLPPGHCGASFTCCWSHRHCSRTMCVMTADVFFKLWSTSLTTTRNIRRRHISDEEFRPYQTASPCKDSPPITTQRRASSRLHQVQGPPEQPSPSLWTQASGHNFLGHETYCQRCKLLSTLAVRL